MTDNPKAPASTDTDVFLSFDAEPGFATEAGETQGAPGQASRSTKLDRASSAHNTTLDLRQDGPAPEASAITAPVAPLPAPVAAPLSREALIDAAFMAPGAAEWLTGLSLSLAMTGSTRWYNIMTPLSPRQVTHP